MTPGTDSILVTHGATSAVWQLGPLPPPVGVLALIGWTERGLDGALPCSVVNVLARALARRSRVTFPSSLAAGASGRKWQASGADYITTIDLGTLWYRSRIHLLSTRREEAVRGLFDDGDYPWWHQGQFALLSEAAAEPPALFARESLLGKLIEPMWAESLREFGTLGVQSILRPAVDGSAAALLCISPAIWEQTEDCLRASAAEYALSYRQVDEEEFAESLAISHRSTPP